MNASKDIRFNFVISKTNTQIAELISRFRDLDDPADCADIFANGELTWGLQSYVVLARRGNLALTCTNSLNRDAVNIVHSATLVEQVANPFAFVLCTRADYPQRQWAHHHLVQNRCQAGRHASYIPHWPQPGLKPRAPGRDGVTVVAYSGQVSRNLVATSEDWRQMLLPLGIDFTVLPPAQWHDLRNVDVLIGLRSFDRRTHDTKPPSKLFNSWHAGIPFIGGLDSAYVQVGQPGVDYLVATTPQEVVDHVLRLRDDHAHYRSLVAKGAHKALQFNATSVADAWEDALLGEVAERFAAWQASKTKTVRYFSALAMGLGLHHSRATGRRGLTTLRRLRF